MTPRLAALVRKELIRPDSPHLAGEDAFRFRHLLIRDAAYEGLSKATRADLHARLASWLEAHAAELADLDELVGYHLEQVCRYHSELGMPEDAVLADAARRRLTAGGNRAAPRQDFGAAANLFERAAALVPPPSSTSPSRRCSAKRSSGPAEAKTRYGGRMPSPSVPSREAIASVNSARGSKATCSAWTSSQGARPSGLSALLDEAIPVFQAAANDIALYIGYSASPSCPSNVLDSRSGSRPSSSP